MSVDEIRREALKLSEAEREQLADELYASLDYGDDDPEFIAMLERRIHEIETGKVKTVPVNEAVSEIRERLRSVRENRRVA